MAYTNFKNGFKVGSASAIDKRILLSKEEMKTAENDYMLPDQYFAICSDDGKLYLFNVNNEPSSDTGKYKEVTADLSNVAFSGNYSDLLGTPSIPEAQVNANYAETDSSKISYILNKPVIGDSELIIKKNNEAVGSFTANATEDVEINIEVPTKTSEIENDSNFVNETKLEEKLETKVDKVAGFGLSKNNFDDAYKAKVDQSATNDSLITLTNRVSNNETDIVNIKTDITDLENNKQNNINEENKLDYSLIKNAPTIPNIDGKADVTALQEEITNRQNADLAITTTLNEETESRINAESRLQTNIDTINNKINKKVLTNIEFSLNGDTEVLTFTESNINLNSGSTDSTTGKVVALADSSHAGLMSPADVKAITELQHKVSSLEGKSSRLLYQTENKISNNEFIISYIDDTRGTYAVNYTISGTGMGTLVTAGSTSKQAGHPFSPTKVENGKVIVPIYELGADIDNLVYKLDLTAKTVHRDADAANINSFALDQNFKSPFTGLTIIIENIYHVWRYYPNETGGETIGWRDEGQDTVSQFKLGQLGTIKGSEEDGKVYAENDGTGSVKGWSNLITQVNTNKTNIENNTTSISNVMEALENKQDKLINGTSTNQTLRWDGEKFIPGSAGVLSVREGTNAISITGNTTTPSINLKLSSTQGNVILTQDDGLKANINDGGLTMSKVSGLTSALNEKVTAVSGKTLTTNDFTNELKSKLDNIEAGATRYVHPTTDSHSPAAVKVGNDINGHVVLGDTLTARDVGISATTSSVTVGDITFNKYSHPAGNAASKSNGFYKFTTDSSSHINSITSVGASDITNLSPYKAGTGLTSSTSSGQVTLKLNYTTCSLSQDGWTENAEAGYFTQTVSNLSGITSDSNPVLDILISPDKVASKDALLEAWSTIFNAETSNGSITFYASEKPGQTLSIQIKG